MYIHLNNDKSIRMSLNMAKINEMEVSEVKIAVLSFKDYLSAGDDCGPREHRGK